MSHFLGVPGSVPVTSMNALFHFNLSVTMFDGKYKQVIACH